MAFRGFVTYLDLYVALRNHENIRDYKYLFNLLKTNSENWNLSKSFENDFQNWCRQFCYRVFTKWRDSKNCYEKFIKKNASWLESEIKWPQFINEDVPLASTSAEEANSLILETVELSIPIQQELTSPTKMDASTSTQKTTRKDFEELTDRQKRRRIHEGPRVRTKSEATELAFSAIEALKSTGNNEVAEIIKHMLDNPEAVSNMKRNMERESRNSLEEISPIKALVLYVTMKLSKWRYTTLREFSMTEGISKYPSYYKIQNEKKKCYPDKSDITVTDTSAKIRLQALLDLTAKRLIESLNHSTLIKDQELVLVSKWGFDGASDQSVYKQKSDEDSSASVFMASVVPLKLTTEDGEIIWQNEYPASTFYCRPLMFKFMKETEFNVLTEKGNIENEISELQPTECGTNHIKHLMLLTMIDGKITSYLSGTAASICDVCHARPSEMNALATVMEKPVCEDIYKYGISSLHAWIRCMECLLHIAYRLEFKTWTAKGEIKQNSMLARKRKIQDDFRQETGLLLDVVKHGSGTTNDGNSARRFFADPEKSASLTGLDVNLIRRFAVILQTISSGKKIKIPQFKQYCFETAEMYVKLYPWYYMPSSIHKLLIHGAEIIEHLSIVPIGHLSEEVSESRNKDFRRYREHHSRKINYVACNEDVLHSLLITSDPMLAQIRPRMETSKKRIMFKEATDLVIQEDSQIDFVDVDQLISDTELEEDSDLENSSSDSEA